MAEQLYVLWASSVDWAQLGLVGPKWPHLWLGQQMGLHLMASVQQASPGFVTWWSWASRSPEEGKHLPTSHLLLSYWPEEVTRPSPDITG